MEPVDLTRSEPQIIKPQYIAKVGTLDRHQQKADINTAQTAKDHFNTIGFSTPVRRNTFESVTSTKKEQINSPHVNKSTYSATQPRKLFRTRAASLDELPKNEFSNFSMTNDSFRKWVSSSTPNFFSTSKAKNESKSHKISLNSYHFLETFQKEALNVLIENYSKSFDPLEIDHRILYPSIFSKLEKLTKSFYDDYIFKGSFTLLMESPNVEDFTTRLFKIYETKELKPPLHSCLGEKTIKWMKNQRAYFTSKEFSSEFNLVYENIKKINDSALIVIPNDLGRFFRRDSLINVNDMLANFPFRKLTLNLLDESQEGEIALAKLKELTLNPKYKKEGYQEVDTSWMLRSFGYRSMTILRLKWYEDIHKAIFNPLHSEYTPLKYPLKLSIDTKVKNPSNKTADSQVKESAFVENSFTECHITLHSTNDFEVSREIPYRLSMGHQELGRITLSYTFSNEGFKVRILKLEKKFKKNLTVRKDFWSDFLKKWNPFDVFLSPNIPELEKNKPLEQKT